MGQFAELYTETLYRFTRTVLKHSSDVLILLKLYFHICLLILLVLITQGAYKIAYGVKITKQNLII